MGLPESRLDRVDGRLRGGAVRGIVERGALAACHGTGAVHPLHLGAPGGQCSGHPELERAIEYRREARARVDLADTATRERWIAARRRAAEVEARVFRQRFRDTVTDEPNRPNNTGKVTRILKGWEGGIVDEHGDGQAMEHGGRLLIKHKEESEAFCQIYAWVSHQVFRDRSPG